MLAELKKLIGKKVKLTMVDGTNREGFLAAVDTEVITLIDCANNKEVKINGKFLMFFELM